MYCRVASKVSVWPGPMDEVTCECDDGLFVAITPQRCARSKMDGSEANGEGLQSGEPGKRTRRRWTVRDKRRIVREAQRPGAVRQEVAQRHGVHMSVLNRWRTEQLNAASGAKKEVSTARLLSVRVRKARLSGAASRQVGATIAAV